MPAVVNVRPASPTGYKQCCCPLPLDLGVVKQLRGPGDTGTVPSPIVEDGTLFGFAITITNYGPSTATNAVLTDALPPEFVPTTTPSWTYTGGASGATGAFPSFTIATMPPGSTARVYVEGYSTDPGSYTNVATVSATAPNVDTTPGNNSSSVSYTVDAAASCCPRWQMHDSSGTLHTIVLAGDTGVHSFAVHGPSIGIRLDPFCGGESYPTTVTIYNSSGSVVWTGTWNSLADPILYFMPFFVGTYYVDVAAPSPPPVTCRPIPDPGWANYHSVIDVQP
jgi:uncharacterized repeat protein (TIGR01451 family)